MFAPHVCLAEMSLDGSEKQQYHINEAKKNVVDNNETSKLFVSILDQVPDGYWDILIPQVPMLWKKMHELEPRGNFIQQFYVHTMKNNNESINTINNFIDITKANNDPYENLLNLLGYKLMAKGDMEGAKKAFSEYIDIYPNGYNAYDSMGEFYLKNEIIDDGASMYKKAVENYPFVRNANSILANMTEQ